MNTTRRHADDDQSLGAGNETPVDLAAVQADDALLDMLGGRVTVPSWLWTLTPAGDRLTVDCNSCGELGSVSAGAGEYDRATALLLAHACDADAGLARVLLPRVLVAWRRDVDTEPIGELVDTDTALAAISAARPPAPRAVPGWVWLLLTFLTSAVVCAAIEVISR